MVVRGQPKGGPPPERTLALSNVTAPKLARRANVQNNIPESKDEVRACVVYAQQGFSQNTTSEG